MLVAALAIDAETFQPRADFRTVLAVLVRQREAQRTVGKANAEPFQQRLVIQTAPLQVIERLRVLP